MICSFRVEWFESTENRTIKDYGVVTGADAVDITDKLLKFFGEDNVIQWTLMPLDGDIQVMDKATVEKVEQEDFDYSYHES